MRNLGLHQGTVFGLSLFSLGTMHPSSSVLWVCRRGPVVGVANLLFIVQECC